MRGGDDEAAFFKLFDRQNRHNLLISFQIQEVDDRLAARSPATLWNLMDLKPVHLAPTGKDQDIAVGRSYKEIFNEILFLRSHTCRTLATASLCPVERHSVTLDVAGMGYGDHHIFFDDHVLDGEIRRHSEDLGTTRIAEAILDIYQFGLDDFEYLDFAGKDLLETLDQRHNLVVLLDNLVALEAGQTVQTHFKNSLSLYLTQFEAGNQPFLCFGRVGAGFDNLNNLIEVVQGDLETFEDVGAGFGFLQLEHGAPGHDLLAVVNEEIQYFAQRQNLWLAFNDRQHDDAKGRMHWRHLVELVEHHLGDAVTL